MADNGGISAVFCIPMSKSKSPACPCGGTSLATCCGPYIEGAAVPQTAEQLMRSRYTAYTQKNEAYLQATWHASTRPTEPVISPNEKLQWLGLEVKSALRLRQRKAENEDYVEFVARFRVQGKGQRLHEISRFLREPSPEGLRWFYVDGTFPE
ncbi:YchJ family protein [Pseudoduganella rivuli]